MNARAVAAVAALDHLARNPKASSARSRREAGSPSHATYTRQPAGSRTSHLPRWLAAALDDPSPVVLPLAFGLSLLAFWEFAVWALNYPAAILPAPSVVLAALIEERALLLANVLPTAAVAAGGFLLAVFVGIALSVAMTWSQVAREALYPNIIAFQLVPKVAWAPMFILWLGIGVEARLGFAMFIAIFPIIINMTAGLSNTDKSMLNLCRALTASKWQTLVYVRFPYALPFLFSAMKISITLAMIGVIVGEFITSQQGLGFVILTAAAKAQADVMLAAVVVLCIMGLAFYGVIALLTWLVDRWFGR